MALSEAMAPLIRRLPRGRDRVYKLLLGNEEKNWTRLSHWPHPLRMFYDRTLKAYVMVDLSDWVGRRHFFYGEYYDKTHRLALQRCLREGDVYVDVGANHGVFTLAAAGAVGKTGRVISFEPNPRSYDWIQTLVTFNGLKGRCEVHNMGLSSENTELVLRGGDKHDGTFTFRENGGSYFEARVPVRRGEEVIQNIPTGSRLMFKVDTEGFEHHVIRGMGSLLNRENVVLWVEVTDKWLRETGSSAEQFIDDMKSKGFHAYLPRLAGSGADAKVELAPLEKALDELQYDVLFARNDRVFYED